MTINGLEVLMNTHEAERNLECILKAKQRREDAHAAAIRADDELRAVMILKIIECIPRMIALINTHNAIIDAGMSDELKHFGRGSGWCDYLSSELFQGFAFKGERKVYKACDRKFNVDPDEMNRNNKAIGYQILSVYSQSEQHKDEHVTIIITFSSSQDGNIKADITANRLSSGTRDADGWELQYVCKEFLRFEDKYMTWFKRYIAES